MTHATGQLFNIQSYFKDGTRVALLISQAGNRRKLSAEPAGDKEGGSKMKKSLTAKMQIQPTKFFFFVTAVALATPPTVAFADPVPAVPEPASLALLGGVLLVAGYAVRSYLSRQRRWRNRHRAYWSH